LRLGDCSAESGGNRAPTPPTPADAILEQHPGAASSSHQTTSESQAGLSRVPGGPPNDRGIPGDAHDSEGPGAVLSDDDVRRQNHFIDRLFDLAA